MDGYKETDRDHGGVHIYSGIPNRAFAEAAVELKGPTAETPARVLWEASQNAHSDDDFATFANRTLEAARKVAPNDSKVEDAFRHGWEKVKVLKTPAQETAAMPDKQLAAAI
jgi:Zn-dependent metalloprotease